MTTREALAADMTRARADADKLAERAARLARILKNASKPGVLTAYYRHDVAQDVSRIVALAHALERDVRGF